MRMRKLKVGMRFTACGCEFIIVELRDGGVMSRRTDTQTELFFSSTICVM